MWLQSLICCLVLWPNLWSVLEIVLCVLEKCIFCCCWMECLLGSFGLQFCSGLFYYWSFVWMFCSLFKMEFEIFYYHCVAFYFSFQLCQCLLHIFRLSDVYCLYIIIIFSWWIDTFYHIISFVSYDSFWPKVYILFDVSMVIPVLFG